MATQAEIQSAINQIITNANYKADQLRPLLTSMLDFSSAGQTLVFDGLVANATDASTTLILQYGVNIIETSTLTDYACKLPQPVTGKRVIVVNKSLMPISLYPSNVGGQINNNLIDAPAIVPPDGKAYDFICIENPLPGAWVWSPPATNQYDSGDISVTTTGTGDYVFAVDSSVSLVTSTPSFESFASYNSPNTSSPISSGGMVYFQNTNALSFKPPGINWNSITRVKVYTNISSDLAGSDPEFALSVSYNINQYNQVDNSFLGARDGGAGTGVYSVFNNIVPGTVPPPGLTANIGDPGTLFGIFDAGVDFPVTLGSLLVSSIIGDQYIGPGTFVFGSTVYNTFDYQSTWICANFFPAIIGNVKFRFFIEYN